MSIPDITFSHHTPAVWVWAGLFLGTVWGLGSFRAHGPRGWPGFVLITLRLTFLALLAWCLLQPTTEITVVEQTKPHFAVLVDRSASMLVTPDAGDGESRWSTALRVLNGAWLEQLQEQCHVRIHPFAATLEESQTRGGMKELKATGKKTHVRDAISQLRARYGGLDMAGILVLSDGLDTREASVDWSGIGDSVPVYTVRLEKEGLWENRPDLEVRGIDTPRRVIVGSESKLETIIWWYGVPASVPQLEVRLLRDGVEQQHSTITMPESVHKSEVTFTLNHAKTGTSIYAVEVDPVAGEQNTGNNTYAAAVEVAATGHRVLYVEPTPLWESKYLTRCLLGDGGIDASILTQIMPGKWKPYGNRGGYDPSAPFKSLNAFEVVILGDTPEGMLTDSRVHALLTYVEKSGSLVLIGGRNAWRLRPGTAASTLARLLPVKGIDPTLITGVFDTAVPNEGRSHPVFQGHQDAWQKLPAILSLFPTHGLKDGAIALLTAAVSGVPRPVMATQRFGEGKVACLLTDTFWRWQLAQQHNNYYRRFWQRLIEWLSAAEEQSAAGLTLAADCADVYVGEVLPLSARLLRTHAAREAVAQVTCRVTCQEQKGLSFAMATASHAAADRSDGERYELAFEAHKPGLHVAIAEADIGGQLVRSPSFLFYAKAATPETMPRAADTALLSSLSRATGGSFCDPDGVGQTLSALEIRPRQTQRVCHRDLWQAFPVSLILVLLLSAEWTLRKSKGMV